MTLFRVLALILVSAAGVSAQSAIGCSEMARSHAADELTTDSAGGFPTAIPSEWLERDSNCPVGMYVGRAQMDSLIALSDLGEWDTEYAAILGSAFSGLEPRAHLGREPWPGGYFGDLQIRIYTTDDAPSEALAGLTSEGVEVAQGLEHRRLEFSLAESEFETWSRVRLSVPVWFIDYGGTATVDAFSTECEGPNPVFVFMYEGWERREYARLVERIIQQTSCPGAA